MRLDKYEESYLAFWMNGQLTDEEISKYVESEDIDQLKETLKTIDGFEVPPFSKQQVWKNIQQDISLVQTSMRKPRRVFIWTTIAAAACFAIALSFYFLRPNHSNSLRTDFGEQLTANLPDGSTVALNAVSNLNFDHSTWEKDRYVDLSGEAFFEVKKGSSFTVETPTGSVQVLGTSFNVRSRGQSLWVQCFTGKVSVKKPNGAEIAVLSPGDAVRVNGSGDWNKLTVQEKKPHWTSGSSYFPEDVLPEVIREMERQYGVKFEYTGLDSRIFSGSFVHNDLDMALSMVFKPMGISYTINEENTIILSE